MPLELECQRTLDERQYRTQFQEVAKSKAGISRYKGETAHQPRHRRELYQLFYNQQTPKQHQGLLEVN